jgi:trk system potassium uptake protein TrkA
MPQRAIIAGGGPLRGRVATLLGDYGHDPVVIEQDADRYEQPRAAPRTVHIDGDATRPDILDQADPEHADLCAALTESPERNRTVCRRVRRQAGEIRTVARGVPSGEKQVTDEAVDHTVHIPTAGASAVVSTLLGYDQQVCSVPTSGFDLVELRADPRAPATNRELSDVAFPSESHVVADLETMAVAGPSTRLRPDRRYLLAVEPTAADTVRNLFQGVR